MRNLQGQPPRLRVNGCNDRRTCASQLAIELHAVLTCLMLAFPCTCIRRVHQCDVLLLCWWQGLSSLRQMDLQSNQLSRLEDLNLLRKYVCCLTNLDLRGNPLVRAPSYTPLTLRRLPHLAVLDGKSLGGTDWEMAAASHGLLTVPMLEQCASTRLLSIWSTPSKLSFLLSS